MEMLKEDINTILKIEGEWIVVCGGNLEGGKGRERCNYIIV